jgi:hypothetical protein
MKVVPTKRDLSPRKNPDIDDGDKVSDKSSSSDDEEEENNGDDFSENENMSRKVSIAETLAAKMKTYDYCRYSTDPFLNGLNSNRFKMGSDGSMDSHQTVTTVVEDPFQIPDEKTG